MKNRWLCLILVLCMVLAMTPAAFAADRVLSVGENAAVSTGWYTFRPAESGQYAFYSASPMAAGIIEAYTVPAGAERLTDSQKTAIRAKLQYQMDKELVEDARQQIADAEKQLAFGHQQVDNARRTLEENAPSGWNSDLLQRQEYEEGKKQIEEAEEALRQAEEQLAAGKAQLAQMEQELSAEQMALPDANVDVTAYSPVGDTEVFNGGQDYWLYVDVNDQSITLIIQMDGSIAPYVFSFRDIPADAYYKDSVEWAAAQGITNGTDGTHFSPDMPCTRGQIVTLLWRAAGEPEESGSNPFVDVTNGDYYAKAVQWATRCGITKGTDETHFSPEEPCTRAQAMTFLYRALDGTSVQGYAPFVDVTPDDYFYHPVAWAVYHGITNGTDETHFSPNDPCTRAQIVTLLYRSLT